MARTLVSGPFDSMRRPRAGPDVRNMGGFGRPSAPLERRPVAAPAVPGGPPGPAPLAGPVVTPSAQAAQTAAAGRRGRSRRRVKRLRSQQYGRSGGVEADDPGSLEGQVRGALGGMFSGQTSKGFVDRARQALGAGVEGQRASASRRIDDDAIRRGLFKSGIPSEQQTALGTSSQGAFSQGLADILSNAEQQDIQGRQFATQAGTNLLGMNRQFDSDLQRRIDAARRGGRGGPGTSTIIDPDTGQSYEVGQDVLRYL